MNDVERFLDRNGLKLDDKPTLTYKMYKNDKCEVILWKDHYEIYNVEEEGTVYSSDLNIYWLIGYLTYYNLIDKNYK